MVTSENLELLRSEGQGYVVGSTAEDVLRCCGILSAPQGRGLSVQGGLRPVRSRATKTLVQGSGLRETRSEGIRGAQR